MESPETTLPWYQSGLSFECTQCGNCCSGPRSGYVWVNDSEIERLAVASGYEDMDLFEKHFVRRVGIRKSLVEYSDGDCIFLDPQGRGCTVYAARPQQCRTWSFWNQNIQTPQHWAATAKECPGCNRGKVYSLADMRRYREEEA